MTNPPPDCGHFVALRHPGHRYELPDSNSLSASKGDSVSAGSPVFVFARFSAELRGDPTTLSHGRWTETDLCAQIGDRVSGGQFATVVFSIADAARIATVVTCWPSSGCCGCGQNLGTCEQVPRSCSVSFRHRKTTGRQFAEIPLRPAPRTSHYL